MLAVLFQWNLNLRVAYRELCIEKNKVVNLVWMVSEFAEGLRHDSDFNLDP